MLRVECVGYYDEYDRLIKDYEPEADRENGGFFNYDYQTATELINDIAERLAVDPKIIEIE